MQQFNELLKTTLILKFRYGHLYIVSFTIPVGSLWKLGTTIGDTTTLVISTYFQVLCQATQKNHVNASQLNCI